MDLPSKDVFCHHTGFTLPCRQLVAEGKCNRWMLIQGKNPQTGADINKSDCVDNWTPFLLIENSQMQRQTGAAVESFRNEVVKHQERLSQTHDPKLLDPLSIRDSRLPNESVALRLGVSGPTY